MRMEHALLRGIKDKMSKLGQEGGSATENASFENWKMFCEPS